MENGTLIWKYLDNKFDIREYLQKSQLEMYDKKNESSTQYLAFERVKKHITHFFEEKYKELKEHEQAMWIKRQHQAILGITSAIEWIKREIENELRRTQQIGVPYPSYYSDLVEATYQETYGMGVISTWWKHPQFKDMEAARIIGTKVYFDLPDEKGSLQPIKYANIDNVIHVAKQLSLRNPNTNYNPQNPTLAFNMADGTRVTVIAPPWVVQPVIVFRNYTKKRPTLELIESYGTYPKEVTFILKVIAKGRGTSMLCGPVKSGKTTLLGAMIAERDKDDKISIIQYSFDELKISDNYPEHQVMEYIMDENNEHQIFDIVLRSEYDYIVIGEIRSKEGLIFLKVIDRSLPGALATYHTPDLDAIPSQLADVVLDEHPEKDFQAQYLRAVKGIHFAIGLEELKDVGKKLMRITVYDWNPVSREFKTFDLVSYDFINHRWIYTDYIPPRVFKILEKYAGNLAHEMQALLTRLVRDQEQLVKAQ